MVTTRPGRTNRYYNTVISRFSPRSPALERIMPSALYMTVIPHFSATLRFLATHRLSALCLCTLLAAPHQTEAADLEPATVAAFDRYVAATEIRTRAPTPALWIDQLPDEGQREAHTELQAGHVFVERLTTRDGGREIEVPGGLIHHWIGTVFVPGTSTAQAVRLLQDYDHHAELFAPMVQRSRTLSKEGDHFTVFLRFYQKKGITVIVNSDHDARFTQLAAGLVAARIVSTRIQEVENPGPNEREKPVGHDGGYLWRLNTYWRFVERDDGVYVQCESVTLTRGIPFGLGWLIGPFVTSIPRESLTFTLDTALKTLRRAGPGLATITSP